MKQRPHAKCKSARPARAGFSLLELSIVIVIISITATLGLELAGQFVARRAYAETQTKLAALDEAMVKFYRVYGRLPCPAQQTSGASEGLETFSNCDPNINPIIRHDVVWGAVPFVTMNLPKSATIDGYGNQVKYMVTRVLPADPNTHASENFNTINGLVEIRTGKLQETCTTDCTMLADPAANTGAAYAIYSHGKDARGAVSAQGAELSPCYDATSDVRIDTQNCARNVMVLDIFSGLPIYQQERVLYDSRFNNGSQLENYFDDIIVWRTKARLM